MIRKEKIDMIKLSNSHEFEYMAASGALKFNGKGWSHEQPLRWISQLLGWISPQWEVFNPSLFTVVSKTLTRQPKKGNFRPYWPLGCIRLIFQNGRIVGVVNAVALTNPGIEWFCRRIGPKVDSRKIALVGSILADGTIELREMVKMLNDFDLVALEMNESCPNIKSDFLKKANAEEIVKKCEIAKDESRFPLILKLSVVHNIDRILSGIEGIIQGISINSVPWSVIFPDKKSPLAHLGGGAVSGEIAQRFTWEFVRRLVGSTDIPIIGPSVWRFEDIEVLRRIGAKAISFGSIFVPPWRSILPTLYVKKDMKRN